MPIRLMVSDVDGTLVDKDKKLTDATIAAVKRLRDAGVAFTVISARPMSGIQPLLEPLGLDEDVGAFNGGIVFRRDGTIVSHHTIDANVARGVIDMAAGEGVDTWVFADDQWFATDGDGPHTASERVSSNQEPAIRDDFADLLDHADKITFVSDDADRLHALYERAHAQYGEQATIAQSQTYYLDVTALAANKGDGVVALARSNGVDLADTAVIGDQHNDLPMLRRAGLPIAMGNAPDDVKAAARKVTRANDEDGVAHAIETIILPTLETPK
ncbi:Cof-type HAD-IIB family hydrolase [Sphingomonas sp. RHCKR47]|uniref:Cof-type HAD-IIB family hydrolase n=1 Tax=Sphingomonas citricola TaxID=2862498 RepID=UPI001C6733F1|nr:Cof-type HAD-IIB family hydrolase [Sphingomonas citricola]MBW6524558.1 Cof-type HAD-IIB family hydrolase [Sphingomonas citricola]